MAYHLGTFVRLLFKFLGQFFVDCRASKHSDLLLLLPNSNFVQIDIFSLFFTDVFQVVKFVFFVFKSDFKFQSAPSLVLAHVELVHFGPEFG